MHFTSTRDAGHQAALSVAIRRGIAPDGGLYVPEWLPRQGEGIPGAGLPLPRIAQALLGPFFAGDPLEPSLRELCEEAFDFPAPLTRVASGPGPAAVLELFHGPTAAFKDFGARFLAAALERLKRDAPGRLTLLVATSGDTGGAVAAAFHRRPWVDVVVLYPKGLVSPRQEKQLTCWGGNVAALAVRGTFDDCQELVMQAFLSADLRKTHEFSSANSINIGRLLPQIAYYAAASLDVRKRYGVAASFIVPAGNLGNALACIWARRMGMPIDRIVLAHNANRAVPDLLASGEWRPRASVPTLASAMDVGNPSNLERLLALCPEPTQLRSEIAAASVTDDEIRAQIRLDYARYGRVWCPHTATAARVYDRLSAGERSAGVWVLVATAHPAKFNDVVEPLIGAAVTAPPSLERLLTLPGSSVEIAPDLDALAAALPRP